jgi:hypothetical protein
VQISGEKLINKKTTTLAKKKTWDEIAEEAFNYRAADFGRAIFPQQPLAIPTMEIAADWDDILGENSFLTVALLNLEVGVVYKSEGKMRKTSFSTQVNYGRTLPLPIPRDFLTIDQIDVQLSPWHAVKAS